MITWQRTTPTDVVQELSDALKSIWESKKNCLWSRIDVAGNIPRTVYEAVQIMWPQVVFERWGAEHKTLNTFLISKKPQHSIQYCCKNDWTDCRVNIPSLKWDAVPQPFTDLQWPPPLKEIQFRVVVARHYWWNLRTDLRTRNLESINTEAKILLVCACDHSHVQANGGLSMQLTFHLSGSLTALIMSSILARIYKLSLVWFRYFLWWM